MPVGSAMVSDPFTVWPVGHQTTVHFYCSYHENKTRIQADTKSISKCKRTTYKGCIMNYLILVSFED